MRTKHKKKDGGGFKSFTIPFTINSPGRYSIPSIRFSFFDALNARYKTITNIPIEFSVVKEGGTAGTTSPADSGMYHNRQYFWTGLVIVLVIALLTMLLVRKKKKHRAIPRVQQPASKHSSEVAAPVALSVNGALQAAAGQLHQDGSQFSTSLKQGILQYLESRFGLPASSYSTELMQQTLTRHQVPESLQTALRQLLDEIDINIYSGGGVQTNKKQLLDQAMVLLQQL